MDPRAACERRPTTLEHRLQDKETKVIFKMNLKVDHFANHRSSRPVKGNDPPLRPLQLSTKQATNFSLSMGSANHTCRRRRVRASGECSSLDIASSSYLKYSHFSACSSLFHPRYLMENRPTTQSRQKTYATENGSIHLMKLAFEDPDKSVVFG